MATSIATFQAILKFCATKNLFKKTINKKNAQDQKTEIFIVKGPVEEVFIEEITSVMKNMQLGKASGLFEVSMEMINASGKVGIDVMITSSEST